ncbi:MAG TPA: hypothetical protein VK550_28480 [Polyangiaceae bacterium]|nr:hypothetical protein [Polyangiaceae bacterium]
MPVLRSPRPRTFSPYLHCLMASAVTVLASCSDARSTDDDSAASTASALELTSAPAPACAATDLVKSACTGPWHYHRWGTCSIRSSEHCGWDLCRDPSFGWEVEPGQMCWLECDPEPPWCDPGTPPNQCPRETCWQVCGPDPDRPGLANLGRGAVCGAATCAFADPSCAFDPALSVSASGLTLEQLKQQAQVSAQVEPVCTTCDQIAMDTPGSVRNKFACLQSRFSDPAMASPDVHTGVGARMRVVTGLAGDQLTAAQRAAARDRFTLGERQTALACEPQFSLAVPAECPPEAASSLERDLAYCARVSATENAAGRASVAWVAADDCVALFERVNGASDEASPEHACVDAELSTRVGEIARTIVGAAIAALDERQALNDAAVAPADQRYPELERTLVLMDRWYKAQRQSLALAGNPDVDAATSASISEITGAFWASAHKARRTTAGLDDLFASGTPSEGEVSAAIGLTAARADRLDRDVLRAAYSGLGAPIPAVQSETVEVLPAIVVTASAVSGDLLLKLSAEALTGLRRNLERVEPFHDIACRLGGCGPRALTPSLANTNVSNLWRAIAALDRDAIVAGNHETLGAALARLSSDDPWRAVFQRVSDNHAALRSAVDAATGESESVALEQADVGTLGLAATGAAEVVRTASERSLAYLANGMFGIESERRIHANVSAAGRQATIAAINDAHSAFSRDIEHYQTERRDAVRDALAQSDSNRALDAATVRLTELDRALELLNSDAAGLSASLKALDRGLGATADRMADIEGPLDTGSFVSVGDTRRFVVHGFNASRVENAEHMPQPIELLAAGDIELGQPGIAKIAAQANQLVVVEASGEYTPLCALTRLDSSHPEGLADVLERYLAFWKDRPKAPPLSFAPHPGTTVGPEGFQLSSDSSRVEAHSADEDMKDSGHAGRIVGGLACIPIIGGGLAQGFKASLNSIDPIDDSSTSSQSDSVRFQGGLRLPNTPFPNLPAGALLLIELPPGAGNSGDIRAVHIVQRPSTTFVLAADSELYFVVNDAWAPGDAKCGELSPPNDPNAITVSVRLATPTTTVAIKSIEALRQVIDETRATRATILAQGRVLQSQLTQIGADATLRLQTLSGFELAAVPPVLHDLIDAYLRREVSAIEIAVERQALERRATDVMLEVDAMIRDQAALQASAEAATLLPVWRLRTFDEFSSGSDEHSLVESAQKLGASAAETLLPIMELWHPEAIRNARASSSFKLDAQALANIGPDGDPLPLIDDLARLLQKLRDAYAADPITHLPDPLNQPIVGVSFRRPAGWRPGCPGCPASTTGLPNASTARAFAVWNAIEAALRSTQTVPVKACTSDADCSQLPGTHCKRDQADPACVRASTRVEFGIDAEDVYRRNGGQATLSCFLATPAVQQWGLYFANQTDDYDEELRQLSLSGRYLEPNARASQPFMTEGGLLDFKLTDPAALVSGMSLLYGSDEAAYSNFQELANEGLLLGRNPVGLSGLSDLTVDFAPLATMTHSFGNGIGESPDRPVTEVVLFMRLDARQFATDPPGHELEGIVNACKPPPHGSDDSPPPPPPSGDGSSAHKQASK